MAWIGSHMKWIMLVSGTLTCTMAYAAIAPKGGAVEESYVKLDEVLASMPGGGGSSR